MAKILIKFLDPSLESCSGYFNLVWGCLAACLASTYSEGGAKALLNMAWHNVLSNFRRALGSSSSGFR